VRWTKYLRCNDGKKCFEARLAIVEISWRKVRTTIHWRELWGKPHTHWPPSSTRCGLETQFQLSPIVKYAKKNSPAEKPGAGHYEIQAVAICLQEGSKFLL
jgi:hypothetical protein